MPDMTGWEVWDPIARAQAVGFRAFFPKPRIALDIVGAVNRHRRMAMPGAPSAGNLGQHLLSIFIDPFGLDGRYLSLHLPRENIAMHTLFRVGTLMIPLAGALLLAASTADSALLTVPEYRCQAGRYKAAGQFAACEAKAQAHLATADEPGKQQAAVTKCLAKYAAAWVKLQAKASGTGATCDAPRFVDNGDGTVTDNLTALAWEQKAGLDGMENPADPHDADNRYTWNAGAWDVASDGTAFTSALPPLNETPCLGDMCDWRLPTFLELQTILIVGYPCTTSPCVDPTFGPTASAAYWSSTSDIYYPYRAWTVTFLNGAVVRTVKTVTSVHVRAVRGGL